MEQMVEHFDLQFVVHFNHGHLQVEGTLVLLTYTDLVSALSTMFAVGYFHSVTVGPKLTFLVQQQSLTSRYLRLKRVRWYRIILGYGRYHECRYQDRYRERRSWILASLPVCGCISGPSI